MNRSFLLATLVVASAATANAQSVRATTPASRPVRYTLDEPNSARIGVYLGENTLRDTAGVLINSVIKDSPADKAGIKEGDRIAAIDAVNLKMSRDDVDDAAMRGMMSRRLTRELDKHKPGDEVELKVTTAGSTRTVRVKTVSSHDLDTTPAKNEGWQTFGSDRPALGINLGGSPSKRDTLGVFVAGVNEDGPAEKAGIVEGDRIARINGTDLRVQGPEAGDADMTRALINRFTREVGKLKAGDAVTLTVVSGGRSREVKLNAAKASDLHGSNGFFFGDGFQFDFPHEFPQLERLKELMPGTRTITIPRDGGVRTFTIPNDGKGGTYYFNGDGAKIRADVKEQVEKAMEKARASIEKARGAQLKALKDDDVIKLKPGVRIIRSS